MYYHSSFDWGIVMIHAEWQLRPLCRAVAASSVTFSCSSFRIHEGEANFS